MGKINNLLNQVAIINKKNAEILDATGGRFNMFRVCGVNHYENTHSAILAELLNPNGTHGLKSKLLECFIETLGDYFTIEKFDFEKSRIHTEHSTEEGRIDILIEDNQNKSIIIENRCHYGLCNNPNVYRISEENRKTLHENLNKLDIFSRKESNWWPFYAHYTNLSLDTWESDIIKSDNFLNECKDKIEKLLIAMEGINF